METKQETVRRVYEEARKRGLCHNQKEFAELIGLTPSTVSSAINGLERALTDRLIKRVLDFEKINLAQKPEERRPDVVIPADTIELYTAMAKAIDRLTELVNRLQAGGSFIAPPPRCNPLN